MTNYCRKVIISYMRNKSFSILVIALILMLVGGGLIRINRDYSFEQFDVKATLVEDRGDTAIEPETWFALASFLGASPAV